jgi:hypothetical protein
LLLLAFLLQHGSLSRSEMYQTKNTTAALTRTL